MTSLAVIVPVLDRPDHVEPLMRAFADTTPAHRLLFVANESDAAELAALEAAGADFIIVPDQRRSWACKINDGYRATTEDWMLLGADDIAPHADWFERALAWASDKAAVIGTNDLWNPRVMCGEHATHPLVRRDYIAVCGTVDEPNLVIHEGYGHDCADDELVQTAMARGVYIHAFDSIVQHLRPRFGRDEDATYKLGRTFAHQGRQLFARRKRLWQNPEPHRAPVKPAAVVTASYGGVDLVLHPQVEQDIPVDWVCFTDSETMTAPAPWRVVHAPARYDDPVLAAKVHKATPTVDVADVVWIDASHQVTSRTFVREALAARRDGVAAFKHPRRNCIYEEADASLGAEGQGGKYETQPLLEQVAAYRAEGHPAHGGLWACGTVAWDLADERAVAMGKAWLDECVRWSWQDQLSFPVVARRAGIAPGRFPVRQIERSGREFLANRWLRIWPHQVRTAEPSTDMAAAVSVLIPFDSDEPHRVAAFEYVQSWYARHFPDWQIVPMGMPPALDLWSKGHALSAAVLLAEHDILVIADADSFTDADTLAEAVRTVASGTSWVVPHRAVYRLTEQHTAEVLAGADPVAQRDHCCRNVYAGPAGGGITVLSRDAWRTVGGIDHRFLGWGGEDESFGWALMTLCGPVTRLKGQLIHLWHPQDAAERGKRQHGRPESEALAGRYREARGHPAWMRALVDEHAAVAV